MSKSESQAYRMVAIEFAGQDRAKQVADLVKKYQGDAGIKVKAWAVVEVDDKGKAHVKQSGHGGVGTAAGAGVGALLGLLGGPAGLLIWGLGGALVGGLAGKYMGHQFDQDELKALAASMEPNTSGLIVIAEDKVVEQIEDQLSDSGGQFVSVTVGSQLTGELANISAVNIGDAGAADEADAAPDDDSSTSAA
jgi:uncharacterized membrane protein